MSVRNPAECEAIFFHHSGLNAVCVSEESCWLWGYLMSQFWFENFMCQWGILRSVGLYYFTTLVWKLYVSIRNMEYIFFHPSGGKAVCVSEEFCWVWGYLMPPLWCECCYYQWGILQSVGLYYLTTLVWMLYLSVRNPAECGAILCHHSGVNAVCVSHESCWVLGYIKLQFWYML